MSNMANSKNKTVETDASVEKFLATINDDQQRADSMTIIKMMQDISGEPPKMWGSSIIGFGTYHYKYESGREGDMPQLAFSPRKGKLALYLTPTVEEYADELANLGPHKTAKVCLYIKKLEDIDINVLDKVLRKTMDAPNSRE